MLDLTYLIYTRECIKLNMLKHYSKGPKKEREKGRGRGRGARASQENGRPQYV